MRRLLYYVVAASAFKSSFINLGGVRHHVRDTGESDGPLALFFHGFAGSAASFEDVAPLLAAQQCRCIAVDRVAFGLTDRPSPASLPAPPKLPGSATLAASLEGGGGPQYLAGGLLPEARAAIASGLRRPETLAPSLPWTLAGFRGDPYAPEFQLKALSTLLRRRLAPRERDVFVIGHSAGGPYALRSCTDLDLPRGHEIKGCALIAPAVLDPREDPEAYADFDAPPLLDLPDALPESLRNRAETEARNAAFGTLLALPDAFALPTARRIADDRNFTEAVLGQMHPRMGAPEHEETIRRCVAKYTEPLELEAWDVGLLRHYRAERASEAETGRALIERAKGTGSKFLTVTGDVDRIVPASATATVADLLGAEARTIADTGHLPLDERPQEVADVLLEFISS
mgnify:FL=1